MRLAWSWTQAEVAKRALATQAMISYVEAGKRVASRDLVRGLDTAFQTGGFFSRLYRLVTAYAYPTWMLPYTEMERDATLIRCWQSNLVPGLLQTRQYAHAALTTLRPGNAQELLEARMARQDVLVRDIPPRASFVLDESVLRRQVGSPEVMREQYQHVLHAAENPHTVIQIVPDRSFGTVALTGPYSMLSFDEGNDLLYSDGYPHGRIALDPAELRTAAATYDLLRSTALPPQATTDLIHAYLKGTLA